MTTYIDAVKELYFFLFSSKPSNYHAVLYHLISKADPQNLALLRLSYPMEVQVWLDWQQSGNEKLFFAEHGFNVLA